MSASTGKIAYVAGHFVPISRASVPITDRSFLYGDGVFESVPLFGGRLLFWEEHARRLFNGLASLRIKSPVSVRGLRSMSEEMIFRNKAREGMLRLQISRGSGLRGYGLEGAREPFLVATIHSLPENVFRGLHQWKAFIPRQRLAIDPALNGFKHCNKLVQILGKIEAQQAGADEPIFLNTRGQIAEGAAGNVWWIRRGVMHTPALDCGILPGVTRGVIFKLAQALGVSAKESRSRVLKDFEGMFFSLSSFGVVEISHLNGQKIPSSSMTQELWERYQTLIRTEKKK
jgi:aminodeoxychorismate lyase